ncbi:hypothetical protein L2E82_15327 [Cichorium intybus]|uniref:Uncharacterized protein n=1 Tax=Cichorium intybus TaxID=13427 RepID=A0ACB9F3S0_CICIN|nr:hypothetical protein L2E82_15327 [Cichorium intybus]
MLVQTFRKVEGTFPDGTKLITVHDPVSCENGNLEMALHGSFLPVPSLDKFPIIESCKIPGELIFRYGYILLNSGREAVFLKVGSHFSLDWALFIQVTVTCTFCIKSLAFEGLSLGSLPPIIQGIKVHELNENHLVFDLMAKWAGNPNINPVVNALHVPIKVQLCVLMMNIGVMYVLRASFNDGGTGLWSWSTFGVDRSQGVPSTSGSDDLTSEDEVVRFSQERIQKKGDAGTS